MNAHFKKNQKSNDNFYIFETGDYTFIIELKLYHIETLLDLLKKLLKKEYRMTLKNYENSL